MIPLSDRTRQHVRLLFPETDLVAAEALLAEGCGDNLPLVQDPSPTSLERLRFAALRLSGGRLPQLQNAIALAKADWRDLLVAAGFGHDITAHERWVPLPLTDVDRDLWQTGMPVAGARFAPGAAIQMTSGWALGQEGHILELLRVDPEPIYQVELAGGRVIEGPQSCLRVAG